VITSREPILKAVDGQRPAKGKQMALKDF